MHHEGQDRERKPQKQPTAGTELAKYPVPELPAKPAATGAPLIEFSTEAHEDPNEGIVFGEMPCNCTCPHCDRQIVTFIDYEASWVTWLLGFVVWFSLGWMAFWVLPLLWPAFKDVVHHCPRCLNSIARRSRISFPTFRTEVCSLKIGNCAVVLARKYVIVFIGLMGTIVAVYLLRSFVHLNSAPEMSKGEASLLSWEDFLYDCGPKTSLRSRGNSGILFEEKYRKKTFTWQGEVRVIREGFEIFFLKTKSVVMVRMYPSRFPRRDLPDVALLFGDSLNKEIAELNPGDWVEFEATMTLHGYRGDPELMTLWHVKSIPRPEPLLSSAGSSKSHLQQDQKDASMTPVAVEALRMAHNAVEQMLEDVEANHRLEEVVAEPIAVKEEKQEMPPAQDVVQEEKQEMPPAQDVVQEAAKSPEAVPDANNGPQAAQATSN
jgi:hypothetical protein